MVTAVHTCYDGECSGAGDRGQRVRMTEAHRRRIVDVFEGEEDFILKLLVFWGVKQKTVRSIIKSVYH